MTPTRTWSSTSRARTTAKQKTPVRQAIEYVIDKVAIGQASAAEVAQPVGQIPAAYVGYQQFDLYPTSDRRGDPKKAKQMLAAAGHPNGLTLKPSTDRLLHPAVAQPSRRT